MENYNAKESGEFINIGTGKDLTINELAEMIKHIVGFKGKVDAVHEFHLSACTAQAGGLARIKYLCFYLGNKLVKIVSC